MDFVPVKLRGIRAFVNYFTVHPSFSPTIINPLSSDRQHLSYDVCLEEEGTLSELFCVVLCTEAVHSHKHI